MSGITTNENSAINQIGPANNVVTPVFSIAPAMDHDYYMQISPETIPNNEIIQEANVNRFCYNYLVRQNT